MRSVRWRVLQCHAVLRQTFTNNIHILDTITCRARLLCSPPPPSGRPSRACRRRRPCRNEPGRLQLAKHVSCNVRRIVLLLHSRRSPSKVSAPPSTPRPSPNGVSSPQLLQQRVQYIFIRRVRFLYLLPLSSTVFLQ